MVCFQVWLIYLTATRKFQLTNLHVLITFTLFYMRHPVDTEKKEGKIYSKYVASLKNCFKFFYCTDPRPVNHYSSRLPDWSSLLQHSCHRVTRNFSLTFLDCQLSKVTLQREGWSCCLPTHGPKSTSGGNQFHPNSIAKCVCTGVDN